MRAIVGGLVSMFVVLTACGSGGDGDGGDGGGGGTPSPIPFVDVAVRGTQFPNERIHLYYDVLAAEDLVSEPDVEIELPPAIQAMGLTANALVIAQDLADPNADRIFVYDDADLQADPVTPGVQVLIPLVGASTGTQLLDLAVHGEDAYVLSLQRETLPPPDYRFRWVVHVFRDVASLTNASVPAATVLLEDFVAQSALVPFTNLAVDADVLAVHLAKDLHLVLDPQALSGSATPDTTLDPEVDLGFDSSRLALGAGRIHLLGPARIQAFASPRTLAPGQAPLFSLAGPSLVFPLIGGAVEVDGRLYTPGVLVIDGPPVVGFDLDPLPLDHQPPDVVLDVPVVGEQQLAAAGGALITVQSTTGTIAVFDRAGAIQDEDAPDGYLFGDYIEVVEIDAVER